MKNVLDTVYRFIDRYYLPVYLVLLVILIGIFVLAFKKRSDPALVLGLILAVVFILFLYHNPESFFSFDIVRSLVTLGAMVIYGGMAFFAVIARAFWVADRPRTAVWQVFLIALVVLGIAMSVNFAVQKFQ